jgi:uncharacterized protein (TIGR02466 family)
VDKIIPFSTNIYVDEINTSHLLNFILNIKNNNKSIFRSNAGGWHSDCYIKSSNDFMSDVLEKIEFLLKPIYKEYGIKSDPKLVNYWFNINKKNDYNINHNHPHSFFSGCLYVKVPKNSGNIVFVRPDRLLEFLDPDINNENNYGNYYVEPAENRIVIFTSNLEHRVEQNLTEEKDDQRISIAFNYR